MPSARIRTFEDETRDGCEQQVNDFLASIPLSALMDITYGVVPEQAYLRDVQFRYWCLVIFQEN